MKLIKGDKAPEFSLPDQDGEIHNLSDYSGSWLLLYFYPKDMTPGCTKEACNLRDQYDDLQRENIKIVGVSKDTIDSHKKFEQRNDLPFTLLSDEKGEVVERYGAKKGESSIKRVSFLVGPELEIVKVYKDVTPSEHAQEVLADVKSLKNN